VTSQRMPHLMETIRWQPADIPIPGELLERCRACGWQDKDFAQLERLRQKRIRGLLPYLHLFSIRVDGSEYIVADSTNDSGHGWRAVDFGPVINGSRRFSPRSIQQETGETPTLVYTDNVQQAKEEWGQDLVIVFN
jgi:hypothetical protein